MYQYTCPSCKVVLKRQEPIPAGKKIKCPKCEHIFAVPATTSGQQTVAATRAKGSEADSPKAAPAKTTKDDDDWAKNPYRVITDAEEDDTVKAEKQRAAAGIVLDRFKKSKRGPALAKVVVPSNIMLATGIILGAISIIVFIVGLFPIVFKSYYLDTPEFKKLSEAKLEEEWQKIVVSRVIIMVGAACSLIYAGIICVGAFKMRTLESYTWAMIAAVLTTLSVAFIVGLWNIMTLRDKAVIEGFAEEPPPPI
ncbi:MAG: zinc-ribbon domain-containing protein [Gemmataceae bacterium]|nr:zinc-ribbon domain-containing protein [Gemmataceae bacterium]